MEWINGFVRSFKYDLKNDFPLNYLGMLVLLGITESTDHFLSKDRVFQTMDGSFRLFAMPFSKTRSDHCHHLSKNPLELKKYLLDRCSDWHLSIALLGDAIRRTCHDISSIKCSFN